MKKLLFLPLILLSCILSFAQEEESKPIVFIVDASGSMWQKVQNEFKIVLAREVLGDLVSNMPEHQELGLVAYGHREKGDCSDIEELLPLGNTDKGAFNQALKDLNPTGKTPLAQTARQVINTLREQNQAATVILITDGLETCEGDLCDIVREAKAAGVEFVMHIVGFDLGENDKASLECAAIESGGKYVDAEDKDELAEALQETSEWTVDVVTGNLSVKCLRNGELIDCSVYAYPSGSDKDIAGVRTYASEETNPALMPVPTGTYDLTATVVGERGISPMTLSDIKVVKEEAQELVFDFSSGQISLAVTSMGEAHDAVVSVRHHGEKKEATRGRTYTGERSNPWRKELVPGLYDVQVRSVKIKGEEAEIVLEKIEIKPGETTEVSHNFQQAILKVGATNQGDLQDATIGIRDKNSAVAIAQGRTYTSSSSNPKSFILSPGTYEIRVKALKYSGEAVKTITVTLEAGKTYEETAKY